MSKVKQAPAGLLRDVTIYFDLNEQKKEQEKAVKGFRNKLVETLPIGETRIGDFKATITEIPERKSWDDAKLLALLGDKADEYRKPSKKTEDDGPSVRLDVKKV